VKKNHFSLAFNGTPNECSCLICKIALYLQASEIILLTKSEDNLQ
jgi:hypothetical protein